MKNRILALLLVPFLLFISACGKQEVKVHAKRLVTDNWSDEVYCPIKDVAYNISPQNEGVEFEARYTFSNGKEQIVELKNSYSFANQIKKDYQLDYHLSFRRIDGGHEPIPVVIRKTHSETGREQMKHTTWTQKLSFSIGLRTIWWILFLISSAVMLLITGIVFGLSPVTISIPNVSKRYKYLIALVSLLGLALAIYGIAQGNDPVGILGVILATGGIWYLIFTKRGVSRDLVINGFQIPSLLLKFFKSKWIEDEEDVSYENPYAAAAPALVKKLFGDKCVAGPTRVRLLAISSVITIIVFAFASVTFVSLLTIWPLTDWFAMWVFALIDKIFILGTNSITPILTNNRELLTLIVVTVLFAVIDKKLYLSQKSKLTHKAGVTIAANAGAVPRIFGKRFKHVVILEGHYEDVQIPSIVTLQVFDYDWKLLEIDYNFEVTTCDTPESGRQWEVKGKMYIYVKVYDGNKALGYEDKDADLVGDDLTVKSAAVKLLRELARESGNIAISNSTADEVDDNPLLIAERAFHELAKSADMAGTKHFDYTKTRKKVESAEKVPAGSPKKKIPAIDVLKHKPTGWLVGDIVCPGFTFRDDVMEASRLATIKKLEASARAQSINDFFKKLTTSFKSGLDATDKKELAMVVLDYVKKDIAEKRFSFEFPDTIKSLVAGLTPAEKKAMFAILAGIAGRTGGKPKTAKKPAVVKGFGA